MKMLYIGFGRAHASVDGVYVRGLRQNGVEVIDYFFPQKSFVRYGQLLSAYRKHRGAIDILCVGYASPLAVIFLRFLSWKRIIYNALCSEYERKIVSRSLYKRRYPAFWYHVYYWLADICACWCANVIMVESAHQKAFFERKFFVPSHKIIVAWTGADDALFAYNPHIQKFDTFTVLFRGRLLPEAGGEVVVRAAKLLEENGIRVLMLSNGVELPKITRLIEECKPRNLELHTEYLSSGELMTCMQRCHISLGQLSGHSRLQRTIPHKAYESLALKVPYLTARNEGIMEILREGDTCIACNPDDPGDLAEKILWARDHPTECGAIGEMGYRLYQTRFTPRILVQVLLQELQERF
ncbi:MAG: glycosyltransferase [Patescibacteria group bacterium]